MAPTSMTRRTFTAGIGGGALLASGLGSAAAANVPKGKARPFYSESILWDAESGPHENYHVHGLTVTPSDTILAFTEGRLAVCDAGPRDILLRRSTDAGRTWSDSQVVVPSVDGQSWGNPTALVDEQTAEVFLFYGLSLQDDGNTTCSGDRQEIYLVRSQDDGKTWSEPELLDHLFAGNEYEWTLHGPGPGHAIQLESGRLLVQVFHRREVVGHTTPERLYGVAMIYSDDHGATWQASEAIPVDVDYPINENRIWQRADGAIVTNGRSAAGGHRQRITAVSTDDGTTWSEPVLEPATGSYIAVDAGFVRYTGPDGVHRVLHSRPDSARRERLTISVSYDEGHTYRYSKLVNQGPSYYSDLAVMSDGTVVAIFGRDGEILSFPQRIAVATFNLAWLTDGRDDGASGTGISEEAFELAGDDGTADANARGGRYRSHQLGAPADSIEIPFDLDRAGTFDLAVRYRRDADQGKIQVSVDGDDLAAGLVDLALPSNAAYQTYQHGSVTLGRGRHQLRFTLVAPGHLGGTSVSLDHLTLTSGGPRTDLMRDVVVDDTSVDMFSMVAGTWGRATGQEGHPYYGVSYRSAPSGTGDRLVQFRPDVPATGEYEVFAWWVTHANRASDAPYAIHHADGSSTVRVDQRTNGSRWVSLGTYRFEAGSAQVVELSNDADGYVIADAVRLAKR